ncbi:MAG: hypothetical protein D084_Lepto4C00170G0002 [Leptospirillum sp. Group IV 'UBA BS']|nr:MAG: hypothetical protein D084_Lepto4C00170G0002 [Leptospirillum sp. Group IV 'UBA BS']
MRKIPAVSWLEPDNRDSPGFASPYGTISRPNQPSISPASTAGRPSRTSISPGASTPSSRPSTATTRRRVWISSRSAGLGVGFTPRRRPAQELDLTLTAIAPTGSCGVARKPEPGGGDHPRHLRLPLFHNTVLNENSCITSAFGNTRASLNAGLRFAFPSSRPSFPVPSPASQGGPSVGPPAPDPEGKEGASVTPSTTGSRPGTVSLPGRSAPAPGPHEKRKGRFCEAGQGPVLREGQGTGPDLGAKSQEARRVGLFLLAGGIKPRE